MTLREARGIYEWLAASYPRNHRGDTEAAIGIMTENLYKAFYYEPYNSVLEACQKVYAESKTEPHASEIKAALREEARGRQQAVAADPYEELRKHPEWDQLCRAYGDKIVRRTAKISQSMRELKYRLVSGLDT